MTQFNPKIRSNSNPEDVWNSNEVSSELTSISNSINSLSDILLDINTTQTIQGQKTFFNLYLDSDGIETYDSIMDTSLYDVSPVFGAGNIALEYNGSPEEGGFTRDNVSGYTTTLEPLNPSYLGGIINLYSSNITHAGYLKGIGVKYNLGNIPIYSYTYTDDGIPPTLSQNQISISSSLTSLSTVGTSSITSDKTNNGNKFWYNFDTTTNYSPSYLVGGFLKQTGIFDVFLVRSEDISQLNGIYSAYRVLGLSPSTNPGIKNLLPFSQIHGSSHNIFKYFTIISYETTFNNRFDSIITSLTRLMPTEYWFQIYHGMKLINSSEYLYSNIFFLNPNALIVESKSDLAIISMPVKSPYVIEGNTPVVHIQPNQQQYFIINSTIHGDILL